MKGTIVMHNMNKVKMLEFQQQGNERGHLVIEHFIFTVQMQMLYEDSMQIESLNLFLLMLREKARSR